MTEKYKKQVFLNFGRVTVPYANAQLITYLFTVPGYGAPKIMFE